jgi:hypothetical protein
VIARNIVRECHPASRYGDVTTFNILDGFKIIAKTKAPDAAKAPGGLAFIRDHTAISAASD